MVRRHERRSGNLNWYSWRGCWDLCFLVLRNGSLTRVSPSCVSLRGQIFWWPKLALIYIHNGHQKWEVQLKFYHLHCLVPDRVVIINVSLLLAVVSHCFGKFNHILKQVRKIMYKVYFRCKHLYIQISYERNVLLGLGPFLKYYLLVQPDAYGHLGWCEKSQ